MEVPTVSSSLPVSAHRDMLTQKLLTLHHQVGRQSSISPLPRQESDPTFSAVFGSSQSFDKEFNFARTSISEEPVNNEADDER